MLLSNKCICIYRRTNSLLLNVYQHVKITSEFVPLRTFFFKKTQKKFENLNRSKKNELKLLKGIDDVNYTDNLKIILSDPKLLYESYINLFKECKKFYHEEMEKARNLGNPRLDSRDNRVDMLFIFEEMNDLKKFFVSTDSSFNIGYSSASLTLTEGKTALFSGNLCTEVPKDGNVFLSGYANITTNSNRISFNRIKKYDWSEYTHLVFKIRGDGRSYLILLIMKGEYEETRYYSYAHPLYTRGGPYWQIAKIPLSHFYLTNKGHVVDLQRGPILLKEIIKLGITAAGIDGPFKLEIDYIGLECDVHHNPTSPYEEYRLKF